MPGAAADADAATHASIEGAAAPSDAAALPGTSGDSESGRTGTINGPSAESSVLAQRLAELDVPALADKLGVGILSLRDILAALDRPGRDPREDLSAPMFRREVLKLEHLKPGMQLSGTVLNVVDFGAFVDIGLSDSGLIHVSRLANHFVSDPHDVVSVGDILNVWVVEVDEKRRRVSLSALPPGTESPRPAPAAPSDEAGRRGPSKRRKPRRDREQQAAAPAQASGRPSGKPRRAGGTWHAKPKSKAKPKPVVPITDAMADGREPMRTFSDLQQFFQRKRQKDRPNRGSEASGDPT
jgi:uncharacterized protein